VEDELRDIWTDRRK